MQNEVETGNGLIGSPEVPERGKGRSDGNKGVCMLRLRIRICWSARPGTWQWEKQAIFFGPSRWGDLRLRKDWAHAAFFF